MAQQVMQGLVYSSLHKCHCLIAVSRHRIDSDTQSVKHSGNTPNSDNDSETEVDRLLKTKSELEKKFEEMQRKLMEQKMEVKARE